MNSSASSSRIDRSVSLSQQTWQERPCCAVVTKLERMSRKSIRSAMSGQAWGPSAMSPIQNAALATSSSMVGPEANRRFSMRRWGLPSVMP
jgi:hypothetical protein